MTGASVPAPEFTVHAWFNTESPLSLAALRGRVWFLVASQVLSPNSVAGAIPQARRIHETFEPKDVAVIGLHATFEHHDAYSPAVLKAFIHEYRLQFPVALDSPNAHGPIPHTMDRYGMRGTPSLVLIDRSGLIRKHAFGVSDDLALGAPIGALAPESPAAASVARNTAA